MKSSFIIHGAYGTPEQNWFQWLKQELSAKGYETTIPQLPTPNGPNL